MAAGLDRTHVARPPDRGVRPGLWRRLFGESAVPRPAPSSTGDPIGDAALMALRRHRLKPTPEAYALWYRHFAGERPELSRRIRMLEERGQRFDAALVGALYEHYLVAGPELRRVCVASRNVEQLLTVLGAEPQADMADAEQLDERLGEVRAEFEGDESRPEGGHGDAPREAAITVDRDILMREFVTGIVKETAEMRMAAYRLLHRAVESATEIAQLRTAIENTFIEEGRDPISGASSKRQLLHALRRATLEVDDAEHPGMCFLILDLDRFGEFNRRHGRRLGDLLLRSMANRLFAATKRGDTIGRLDGAAFAVVLSRTAPEAGLAMAERLRTIAAEAMHDLDGMSDASVVLEPVTISIGIAALRPGEPVKRLVGRAERARRIAKEEGGDRVVFERASQPTRPADAE